MNETRKQPFIIAIAGGTGSGKTYIARKLHEVAPEQTVSISHDNYYRDRKDVAIDQRKELNYDEPAALDNKLFLDHLKKLKAGEAVDIPQYDFATHTRKRETARVHSAPIIIVEGILIFTDPEIRQLFDLSVFVDVKPDIRLARRLQRDVGERDRNYEESINQYLVSAGPMHDKYVEPGKEFADIIINNNGTEEELKDGITTLQARIKEILGHCE
ncbi:MAG: uridine kinase [Patescibacteria group bacterium]